MPFFAAHCAIGCVSCGSVCDTRTMYGERVVITEVAAFMITIGFFASADTGATAIAFGVSPNPARMSTLSCVDELLCKALGDVGRGSGRILDDELDLLPAEDVAVQLEIRLHAGENLRAVIREGAGELGNYADLHGLLRRRRSARRNERRRPTAPTMIRFAPIMEAPLQISRAGTRSALRARSC